MSSNEEEYDPSNVNKKRRIQRACDICRRKKSRLLMFFGSRNTKDWCEWKLVRCTSIPESRLTVPYSSFGIGNGVQMPGNRCSNCITNNYECTYVETARVCLCHPIFFLILSLRFHRNEVLRRGESHTDRHVDFCWYGTASYVESLENRLQKLEKLLKRVRHPHKLLLIFPPANKISISSYVQTKLSSAN